MEKFSKVFVELVVILFTATILLTGCNLTPSPPILFGTPTNALEQAKLNALSDAAVISDEWVNDTWWHLFEDPQLDKFICQALSDNPSITVAEARVGVAMAAGSRTRAALFPTLDFEGDVTRLHNSANGIFGVLHTTDPSYPLTYRQRNIDLSSSYTFDFVKVNRNQLIAALDEVEALKAEAYAAKTTLALSMAQSYFQYQVALEREKLAHQLYENRVAMIDLTSKRKGAGIDNKLSVNKARLAAINATNFQDDTRRDIILSKHEIQALLADNFEVPIAEVRLEEEVRPFPIPCNLPLDLLAHRPDVWAQRWRVEAAARLICVAQGAFYPNININALVGFQAISFNPLLDRNSLYGLLYGPAIHLPIFEGGALIADLNKRDQEYIQAVGNYDSTVLTATKEVLNALSLLQLTSQDYQYAKKVEEISQNNVKLVKTRARHTLNSRLDILTFENEALQAADTRLKAYLACLQARLNLIRALGGGYAALCEEEINDE